MKREDLLAVLPCYVCDDLPPEVKQSVQALVEADPEVAALLADLSVSQGTCQEAMRVAAPALMRLQGRRATTPARPTSALWPALLALAVLLALRVAVTAPGPSPDERAAAHLDTWTAHDPRELPGYFATGDADELSQAMAAAGVAPAFSQIPAPRVPGLRLLGAAPDPDGEGVILLFVDAQGWEYRCISVEDRPLPLSGATPLPDTPPNAPALRSFEWGGDHAVTWRFKGKLCVFVSDAPRALVEGLARAKVWGGRG